MGLSSKQHKKDLMEDRSPVDSHRDVEKKGSPAKKTKARIAQDYARNAEVDGDTSAGRYEARQAVKEAGSKKGSLKKEIITKSLLGKKKLIPKR